MVQRTRRQATVFSSHSRQQFHMIPLLTQSLEPKRRCGGLAVTQRQRRAVVRGPGTRNTSMQRHSATHINTSSPQWSVRQTHIHTFKQMHDKLRPVSNRDQREARPTTRTNSTRTRPNPSAAVGRCLCSGPPHRCRCLHRPLHSHPCRHPSHCREHPCPRWTQGR